MKSLEKLLSDFQKVHGNKYIYNLSAPVRDKDKILITCPIHGDFLQNVRNHLSGNGCPICAKSKLVRTTKEDFIKRAKLIHGNKYDYSLVEYKGTHVKVKIICPIHGIFEQRPYKHLQKQGCPKCRESKGEKAIRVFLENNKIPYTYQAKIGDCSLPFDFYIEEKHLAIEYDGEQHFNCDNFFSLETAKRRSKTPEQILLEQKERDALKGQICLDNNITLIRLKSLEEVNSKLSKILSGNKIDLKPIISSKSKYSYPHSTKLRKIICIETGEIILLKDIKISSNVLSGRSTYKGKHYRRLSEEEINNNTLIDKNNKEFLDLFKTKKLLCKETGKAYNNFKEAVIDLTGSDSISKQSNICRAVNHNATSLGYHWEWSL